MALCPTTVQFEGSLGRLTASSVHNPRRIIDVSSNTLQDSDEARGREVRRFKKLLLNIEAVRICVFFAQINFIQLGVHCKF